MYGLMADGVGDTQTDWGTKFRSMGEVLEKSCGRVLEEVIRRR